MNYTCVGCGAEFTAEPAADLRCPKCLRHHGLVPEDPAAAATAGAEATAAAAAVAVSRRRYVVGAAVLVAVVAVVVGAVLATRHRGAAPPESRSDEQLRRRVVRAGVPAGQVVLPFAADPGIVSFAREHATGATPIARAISLALAERQLIATGLAQKKTTLWRRQRLPDDPPRTAAELLSALHGDGAGAVRSYEAAVLLLAAARAAGLHTLLAEVHKQGGRAPDPSGSIGAFAVAVYAAPPAPGVAPLGYVDAFADDAVDEATPLDDLAAVGGFYLLRSLAHSGGDADTAAAYRDADWAVKLAPRSALPYVARSQALLVGGGSLEALADLRRAVALRDDAPRQTALAAGYLAAQETEHAESALRRAIQLDPGFAPAHVALAAILALRHDDEAAGAELDAAGRSDPGVIGLRLIRAQLAARKGDLAAAERLTREELAADPGDERAGLMLFGILKGEGKDSEAEKLKADLVKRSRHGDRLRQIFDVAEGKAPAAGGGGAGDVH